MELKEIQIGKIQANPSQPRESFDKEKIKELAESILSNGLINPITVREIKKDKYEIVAGERRWRASQVANLKTIQAVVKTYKNDGQVAIESLIENVHREDLSVEEKGKFLKRIADIENLKHSDGSINLVSLEKLTKINLSQIKEALNLVGESAETRKAVKDGKIGVRQLTHISQIKDEKLKEQVKQKVIEKDLGQIKTQELVSAIKVAPIEVKKALLDDSITVEQAERISKLKTEPERKEAIKEHVNIKDFDKTVEKRQAMKPTAQQQRELAKKLVQAGNWIREFRSSVTEANAKITRTIVVLTTTSKFIPMMDDKQKQDFDIALDRLQDILSRGEQLTEQIKDKLGGN